MARTQYSTRLLTNVEELDARVAVQPAPVILLEGIRKLPAADIELVRRFGRWIAQRYPTVIFRTGNAPGTDTVFAEGVAEVAPDRLQFILPYAGHRKAWLPSQSSRFSLDSLPHVAERRLVDVTSDVSPKLGRLGALYASPGRGGAAGSKGAYILRDTLKVLGAPEIGLAPATAGIFFANVEDPLSGGTGHTISICLYSQIPAILQSTWSTWIDS